MKTIFLTLIIAITIGGISAQSEVRSVTIGEDGGLYVTGIFSGKWIQFDPLDNEKNILKSSEDIHGYNPNIYTAKYNATGKLQWIKVIEGDSHVIFTAHKAVGNSSLILIGQYKDKVTASLNLAKEKNTSISTIKLK